MMGPVETTSQPAISYHGTPITLNVIPLSYSIHPTVFEYPPYGNFMRPFVLTFTIVAGEWENFR